MVEFFRREPFIESREFYLVDRSKKPPVAWMIAGFSPLTGIDIREGLKISGRLDGIPIAHDMDKGTYYVSRDGRVMLNTPNVRGRVTPVAISISAFAEFEASEWLPEELTAVGGQEARAK